MKTGLLRSILREAFILLMGLVFIVPILLAFMNSLKSYAEIYQSPFALPSVLHFENYVVVFKGLNYLQKALNSLIVTAVPIPFILVFGSMAAYKMARTKTRLSKALFYLMISTMLMPIIVIIVPLMVHLKRFALIDSLPGLILVYIGFQSPFSVFLYHGFIKNIKTDIEESARIDGCGSLKIFFFIVFPMLKPISATIAVLLSLYFWNDFLLPMLFISSNSRKTLPLAAFRYIGEYMKDWPMLLPAAILLSAPIFVFFFSLQRYILVGIGQGAVKG
jgi:raffinose/stachyose/melibiose transport system permease protein